MPKNLPKFPLLNADELAFLHRQEKIRVFLAGGSGYGDETASLRVVYWLRSNGYQNWVEIVYEDKRKFKVEELLGLPHDLPAAFKLKRYKISVLPSSSFDHPEPRSKIEYTNLGISGARTDVDCNFLKTKVCIRMSPYRSYDPIQPGYNGLGKDFRTTIGRFDSQQVIEQENSETLAIRQTIPTINDALLFLHEHPNLKLPPWLPGMVKSVQNGNFLVMPVYGILTGYEHEHNALLTILMGMKHAKNISIQFNRKPKLIWVLHKLPQNSGLKELQHKIEQIRSMPLAFGTNHEPLPTDVRIIPANSSASYVGKTLENIAADTIIITETGPLPTPIFNALYTSGDIPRVQEGANSANLLLNTGKPFIRCRKDPSDKYWDEIDLTNASPRLRNLLKQAHQFLCTTPDEFITSIRQNFPKVLGELISESLNPISELNKFFKEFSEQTLATDRLTLGLREAIAIVHKFDLEDTALSPYYETAIAKNSKFVLDGACNHLIPLKIFSHSMSMDRTASVYSPYDHFIPTALHHLLNGNFHLVEALAKNSVVSIRANQIPGRLLFVSVDFKFTDRQYYPPEIHFEGFIKKCLAAVWILKGCKNSNDIAQLKHENHDLSLLLKFAIAFDFTDQIELILDSNPDLCAEHNGWSTIRVTMAQRNLPLLKRFIDTNVTISAEDLHYAAAQIDDVPTFALLEKHVAQKIDSKILLKNVIENNNYKILEFLANVSHIHEAFRQEISNFLKQTDSIEFQYPEIPLEMVKFIIDAKEFPLLLQKCLWGHTPYQLQILLEAIEKNTDAKQFDQVISNLSTTDDLPAKHLRMLIQKFPTHFPLEKFLPNIVEGITKGKILPEDLPELGKLVGDTIYMLGNNSLDELELPELPILPDTADAGSSSQNHALSLFTPVCHSKEQISVFVDFDQVLRNKQCQTTNTGISCTYQHRGQIFHLEMETIGDATSLVSSTQHPLKSVASDFLTCNVSSSSQQIDCRGEYSKAKIFIVTSTPTLGSCCYFFFIGFKESSINIAAMFGIRYAASGILAKITRSQSIIEKGSDLACLTVASFMQPTQTLSNTIFTVLSWFLKNGQTLVDNSTLYLMSFIMANSYNIYSRYRAGENWMEPVSESFGSLAAIPVIFYSAKISSNQLPKVAQFVKKSWTAISDCTTSFLGKLSTGAKSIFSSSAAFFEHKQQPLHSTEALGVVVDAGHQQDCSGGHRSKFV